MIQDKRKQWITGIVQVVLGALLVWYVYDQYQQQSGALAQHEIRIQWGYIALAGLAGLANMVFMNLAWRRLTQVVHTPIGFVGAAVSWNLSILGRYIPGKVWILAFRIALAAKFGGGKVRIAVGYVLESLLLLFTSAFIGTSCILLTGNRAGLLRTDVAVAILVGLLLLLRPKTLAKLVNGSLRRLGEPEAAWAIAWKDLGIQVLFYAANISCAGAAFTFLTYAFADGQGPSFIEGIGIFLLSLLGGALTTVPGGIGAQEVLLKKFLAPVFPQEGLPLLIALEARAFSFLFEILVGLGTLIFWIAWKRVTVRQQLPVDSAAIQQ